jgi:hypothetical protein
LKKALTIGSSVCSTSFSNLIVRDVTKDIASAQQNKNCDDYPGPDAGCNYAADVHARSSPESGGAAAPLRSRLALTGRRTIVVSIGVRQRHPKSNGPGISEAIHAVKEFAIKAD